MGRAQFKLLRILGAVLGVILIGWWAWPDSDRVGTEDELIERAVEALRTGVFGALVAAQPTEADRLHANRALSGSAVALSFAPDGQSLEQAFSGAYALAQRHIARAPLRLVGRDPAEPHAVDRRVRTLPFRVVAGGQEHRFRLHHCFETQRGWVSFGGLHYDGPVDGLLVGVPFGVVVGSETYMFSFDRDLPRANQVELLDQVRACLARSRWPAGYAVIHGAGQLEVTFPPGQAFEANPAMPRIVAISRLLTGSAGLSLGIEVLPDELYKGLRPATLQTRRVPPPWERSAAAFERYKEIELQRIKDLQAQEVPYTPSQQGYRLVKRFGRAGDTTEDYVVVEVPAGREPFDSTAFTLASIYRLPSGDVAGTATLRASQRSAYKGWRRRNLGYRLVIMINGEVHSTEMIIPSKWSDAIQWTYAPDVPVAHIEIENGLLSVGVGLPPIMYALRFEGSRSK